MPRCLRYLKTTLTTTTTTATFSKLSGKDELPYEWGELSSKSGASCLLNGASCLLNVGRVVLGRVFFGASCLGASCLWGELSVIQDSIMLL